MEAAAPLAGAPGRQAAGPGAGSVTAGAAGRSWAIQRSPRLPRKASSRNRTAGGKELKLAARYHDPNPTARRDFGALPGTPGARGTSSRVSSSSPWLCCAMSLRGGQTDGSPFAGCFLLTRRASTVTRPLKPEPNKTPAQRSSECVAYRLPHCGNACSGHSPTVCKQCYTPAALPAYRYPHPPPAVRQPIRSGCSGWRSLHDYNYVEGPQFLAASVDVDSLAEGSFKADLMTGLTRASTKRSPSHRKIAQCGLHCHTHTDAHQTQTQN